MWRNYNFIVKLTLNVELDVAVITHRESCRSNFCSSSGLFGIGQIRLSDKALKKLKWQK